MTAMIERLTTTDASVPIAVHRAIRRYRSGRNSLCRSQYPAYPIPTTNGALVARPTKYSLEKTSTGLLDGVAKPNRRATLSPTTNSVRRTPNPNSHRGTRLVD
jgi:hypothetical protein